MCLINNSSKQKITGIVVNDKIQVDIKYRKKIRQEIYYINKYGLSNHLKRINTIDQNKYLNSLLGRINFVLSVDKSNKDFMNYKKVINELIKGTF